MKLVFWLIGFAIGTCIQIGKGIITYGLVMPSLFIWGAFTGKNQFGAFHKFMFK